MGQFLHEGFGFIGVQPASKGVAEHRGAVNGFHVHRGGAGLRCPGPSALFLCLFFVGFFFVGFFIAGFFIAGYFIAGYFFGGFRFGLPLRGSFSIRPGGGLFLGGVGVLTGFGLLLGVLPRVQVQGDGSPGRT